ncbi:MAG TPA: hypothetical protein VM347_19445 [Nonomuraea sp.]|nr:hypothetical protein [Nonomuraea sp.]
MKEDLPDAMNRDGGESDVVAERSGAETPRARRPILADWPDTETNPAIPVPEITAPATEAESDTAPESEAEATADAERRAETGEEAGEEAGDGGEKEVRPEAGPTG